LNQKYISYSVITTEYHNKEFSIEKLLKSYNDKIDHRIKKIPKIWLPLIKGFLFEDERIFWEKEKSEKVYQKLCELYDTSINKEEFFQRFYDSLEHFFIALSAYDDIINTINLYKEYRVPDPLEVRMYYLPTYNSIVEGCMTNLFKFLRDNLDLVDQSNLLAQTKLNGLIEVMNSRGLDILTVDLDVDIRNAINHGGVYATDEKRVTFFFNKGKQGTQSKDLTVYDLKRKIFNLLDCSSSIFVGVIQFLIEKEIDFNMLQNYSSNKKQMIYESLVKLELSTFNKKCLFLASSTTINSEKQINVSFYTDEISSEEKLQFSILTFLRLFYYFTKAERFFLNFSSERTLPSFISSNANDIKKFITGEIKTLEELAQTVVKNNPSLLWEPYTEEIDVNEAKKAYYQDIIKENYEIRNIQDISMEDIKRFKLELYIKNVSRRNHVKKVVREVVREIKNLRNYPNLKHKIKYGDMPADVIYMSVYKYRAREGRREKYLVSNNDNFIATVQYNVDPKFKITQDSLRDGVWKDLVFRQEGDIEYGWNPNF
jgi:hypothetical protein